MLREILLGAALSFLAFSGGVVFADKSGCCHDCKCEGGNCDNCKDCCPDGKCGTPQADDPYGAPVDDLYGTPSSSSGSLDDLD
ncbi:MAG: hypothetical protein LBF84_00040 [Holosporales bacterium]|nr:hypothetical protein [Holosporales bacterium]